MQFETDIPPAEKDRVLYFDAVRGLSDPIFLLTSDRVLVEANPAGLRLVGLTTVSGVPLSSLVENSDADLRFRTWAQSRSPVPGRLIWKTVNGPESLRLEAWCAKPASDHRPALVIVQCKPFDNIDYRLLLLNERLELLSKEMLARKRAEAQLIEALKARDEFIAVAAHELRNPLNVFHLSLQLLHYRAGEIEGVRDILNRSRFQLNHLNMLIERLLDVSRIRSGRFELQLDRFISRIWWTKWSPDFSSNIPTCRFPLRPVPMPPSETGIASGSIRRSLTSCRMR